VTTSVVVNLGILGFFKYHDFFVQSFADLFHISDSLTSHILLHVTLPVGISFYTFQTMSYTLDVHAGRIAPSRSFLDFALYVAYFPQLVAGPIERGAQLLPQIVNPRRIDPTRMESALHLIAWGLFKKVFIADTVAHAVNSVYGSASPTGPEVYVGTIAFAVQIYCDFSGYSDIARGVSRLMGIELMLNFNLPYIAKNPSDFWRRWHISLSTWLRDYLYISLGGNRKGPVKTYRNLALTMLLGGLWHGARYNFVLWGAYHGALLIVHRLMSRGGHGEARADGRLVGTLKILGMFHLTLIGWLLFRVETMAQLKLMTLSLFGGWSQWEGALGILSYMAPVVVPMIVVQAWQMRTGDLEWVNRSPWPLRSAFASACVAAVVLINRGGGIPFIYFQF